MAERHKTGTWVEIRATVLHPGERAPQAPADTRSLPLEMRVKGFLQGTASIGERADIVTVTGRRLHGTLVTVNPPYEHGFGAPVPELLTIGGELRALLGSAGSEQ